MAHWWTETYDPNEHVNLMKGVVDGVYSFDLDQTPSDHLVDKDVYFVRVAGFTFQFLDLRQLKIAAEYFDRRLKGSSQVGDATGAADHWEVQRWFERLPKGLERKERRTEIAKALKQALAEFGA